MSDNNGLTSIADLFGSPLKRRYAELTLPVSGYRVRIRSWSEHEMSRYLATLSPTAGAGGQRQRKTEAATRLMIAECLVDADGNLLLQAKDIERLKEWDAADTAFLMEKCAEHVGLNTQDVEGLAKNCETTRAANSPSA
jgi:hypothetical protein